MITVRAVVACILVCAFARPAAAVCQGGQVLASHAGKRIVLADDTLFFKTGDIQLDIDGSPIAYGVKDQGIENICNGLGPLRPPECKGKVRGECGAACRAAFREWDGNPATLRNHMCSIGLGGSGCSEPNVKLQAAPRQDFFVSETSVHPVPPAGTSVDDWIKTQPGQLDSLAIPYFVITGGFRSLPWDATPGDVGVVIEQPSGREVAFIVGDTGGALNEGSAKLLAALAGVERLPTKSKTNAFGVAVERLDGARDGDFRVAIFRHTAPLLPRDQRGNKLVLSKSAEELPAFIRDAAQQKLAAIGGRARIVKCTGP